MVSIIYLAGFFDGEGSVLINRTGGTLQCGYPKTRPEIRMGTTKEREPEMFKRKFGGSLYKNTSRPKSHGITHEWILCGKENILDFIDKIKPYLKGKKKEIEVMEEYLEVYGYRGPSGVSEKEGRKRWKLKKKLENMHNFSNSKKLKKEAKENGKTISNHVYEKYRKNQDI